MAFTSKYPGTCGECKRRISTGETIEFDFTRRIPYHAECAPDDLVRSNKRPSGRSYDREEERKPYKAPVRPGGSAIQLSSTSILGTGDGPRVAICAFNRHIAAEMERKLQSSILVDGSPEQQAIWDVMLNKESHLIVNAAAGSGKSFSAQQGVLRMMASLNASCNASTYHSLGLSILRKNLGKIDVKEYKLNDITDAWEQPNQMPDEIWSKIVSLTIRLARICKNYMLDGTDEERLHELADHHNVEIETDEIMDIAVQLVPRLLEASMKQTNIVDFDDMPYMPVMLKMTGNNLDMLIVDELQDTNITQQHLAKLACPNGRIIGIGDEFQSIYSFRGADSAAMARFQEMLVADARGCDTLPLSVTRRCPTEHVMIAQHIVGQSVIRAMDTAKQGIIRTSTMNSALASMVPGDMVLCRVNRHLVPCAYDLIRRGVKAVVRGRDIGAGLESLIKKLKAPHLVTDLLDALEAYRRTETERLSHQRNSESRLMALGDKCATLYELSEGMTYTHEIVGRIQKIFADFDEDGKPVNAVVLGTVHRLKGLESDRVWVLAPELIPHPMARQAYEHQSEANLAYVACTRSMNELIFIGGVPEIYGYTANIRRDDLSDDLSDEHTDDPLYGDSDGDAEEAELEPEPWPIEEEMKG